MKTMIKKMSRFSLIAVVLVLAMVQVKALDIKKPKTLFQAAKTLVNIWVLDEKGDKMEGAAGTIKGREDVQESSVTKAYRISGKNQPIMFMDYPANAILVISKPGYVTKEINTNTLYRIKEWTSEEMKKCAINIKMVPVKKGGKPTAVKKKKT